eukprot:2444681-Rhodomonas_salina.1
MRYAVLSERMMLCGKCSTELAYGATIVLHTEQAYGGQAWRVREVEQEEARRTELAGPHSHTG